MNDATTIRMANQIAEFFKAYPREQALKEIADHINRFWEPRMRNAYFALIAKGGAGLVPAARDAAALVRRPHETHHEHEPKDPQSGLPREAHEA